MQISNRLKSISCLVLLLIQFSVTINAANKSTNDKEDMKLTAREVFKKLQCQQLELLSPSVRLDMLDYWDADSIYKASNAMEGLSWLEMVADTYLKLHVTSVSTFEIKILSEKKNDIILTIYTIGSEAQARDSQLNFYDTALIPQETKKYFDIPELKDYFSIPKGSLTSMKEIREMIPFPTVSYEANPDNENLTSELTVKEFLNQDDWNIIKLFLKPSITLDWKNEKYKYHK